MGRGMAWTTAQIETAMEAALAEARAAAAAGDLPYGAVVMAPEGGIVARAQDRVLRERDPTAHGEICVVRLALAAVGPDLTGHALVSNVEPCAMCATAAWWAKVSTVAYGVSQAELFALRPDAMDEAGLTVEAAMAPFARGIEVVAGVLCAPALALWKE